MPCGVAASPSMFTAPGCSGASCVKLAPATIGQTRIARQRGQQSGLRLADQIDFEPAPRCSNACEESMPIGSWFAVLVVAMGADPVRSSRSICAAPSRSTSGLGFATPSVLSNLNVATAVPAPSRSNNRSVLSSSLAARK